MFQYFPVIFAIVLCTPCMLKPLPRYIMGQCSVMHSRPSALQVARAFSVSVFQWSQILVIPFSFRADMKSQGSVFVTPRTA